MKFGWINLFGAIIVLLMLIPNFIYALRNQTETNFCANRWMNLTEQIGRYGCVILMWFPLLVWEFGFSSTFEMILYLAGNGALLTIYIFVFVRYLSERTRKRTFALAVIPVCIFFLSGVLLRHWLLVGAAVLFAVGHLYVTQKNTA